MQVTEWITSEVGELHGCVHRGVGGFTRHEPGGGCATEGTWSPYAGVVLAVFSRPAHLPCPLLGQRHVGRTADLGTKHHCRSWRDLCSGPDSTQMGHKLEPDEVTPALGLPCTRCATWASHAVPTPGSWPLWWYFCQSHHVGPQMLFLKDSANVRKHFDATSYCLIFCVIYSFLWFSVSSAGQTMGLGWDDLRVFSGCKETWFYGLRARRQSLEP